MSDWTVVQVGQTWERRNGKRPLFGAGIAAAAEHIAKRIRSEK